MIRESEWNLKEMMKSHEGASEESDRQIRKNIQQTYLYKLQEVTRQLRAMEKEHLVRMKDLYGEEGEIIIEQLEKREREYFNLEDRAAQ